MMFSKYEQLTVGINKRKSMNPVSVSYEKDTKNSPYNIFSKHIQKERRGQYFPVFPNLSSALFHAGHLGGGQRDPSIRVLQESHAGKHSP